MKNMLKKILCRIKSVFKKQDDGSGKNERLIREYLKKNDNPKLQIGCGGNLQEGWLNTDLKPPADSVMQMDASKPFPFKDNTFDFIFSEHIFEHLTFKESRNFLSESLRVLKPGGTIRIAVPHLDFLFHLHEDPQRQLHKDYIKWATETFVKDVAEAFKDKEYSKVYVINNFFRDWGHQVIHTYESLKELLLLHNFVNVQRKKIGESDFPELCNMEKHGTVIPQEFNELESMVLEAQKSK